MRESAAAEGLAAAAFMIRDGGMQGLLLLMDAGMFRFASQHPPADISSARCLRPNEL